MWRMIGELAFSWSYHIEHGAEMWVLGAPSCFHVW